MTRDRYDMLGFVLLFAILEEVSTRLGSSEEFIQFVVKCCSNEEHAGVKGTTEFHIINNIHDRLRIIMFWLHQ